MKIMGDYCIISMASVAQYCSMSSACEELVIQKIQLHCQMPNDFQACLRIGGLNRSQSIRSHVWKSVTFQMLVPNVDLNLVITMSADGLAPEGARPSAGTALITRPTLERR